MHFIILNRITSLYNVFGSNKHSVNNFKINVPGSISYLGERFLMFSKFLFQTSKKLCANFILALILCLIQFLLPISLKSNSCRIISNFYQIFKPLLDSILQNPFKVLCRKDLCDQNFRQKMDEKQQHFCFTKLHKFG